MINIILLLFIGVFFIYAVYDQFGMDWLKGKTKLKVRLKKQGKTDAIILIILLGLIIYQSFAEINMMQSFTLFLLATAIILIIYGAFIRSPTLVLKEKGFFFGNLYLEYDKIRQINLANDNIIVIDLKNGRRLLAQLTSQSDTDAVVAFFGGYKDSSSQHKRTE
ncbi:DUF986 family protein [Pasteurellaceae bacterium LIM206]|nr:DUF986 family protein [Pasteurellaceae bacterium LIM206]